MIHLTPIWFVFIYLAIFLAGILTLWIGYEMLRKHLSSTTTPQQIFCRICGASLTDRHNDAILRCHSCGALNESNNFGGF